MSAGVLYGVERSLDVSDQDAQAIQLDSFHRVWFEVIGPDVLKVSHRMLAERWRLSGHILTR